MIRLVLVAEKCAFTQKIGITLAPKKQGDRTAKRSFNHLVGAAEQRGAA
jgi:hypothetical protein